MFRRLVWAFAVLVLASLVLVMCLSEGAFAGAKIHVGRACTETHRPSLNEVDHGAYDALLKKHVDGQGMVAYAAWKNNAADSQALDDYLTRLGCADLSKPASNAAKLAFWINAYNALTLKGILREYPTSSIRNHTARFVGSTSGRTCSSSSTVGPSVWTTSSTAFFARWGEPRIHFAVVCASKGCPPLLNQAYTAAKLDEQLAVNARRFFAQAANFQADRARRSVGISQLLQWYGTDFAASPQEQVRTLRPYLPRPDELAWLDQGQFSVRYLHYDWGLNDQR